jgi:hypothetical protein
MAQNSISKLMTKKHAKSEYKIIRALATSLKSIPNVSRYFLLDEVIICDPVPLLEPDLSEFNKCTPLTKKNITSKNVNAHLNKLQIISMPHGGMPVNKYVFGLPSTLPLSGKNSLREVSESLISLLKNGIVPMNKANIYHLDIKDSNILVKRDDKKLNARIIDWGISIAKYVPGQKNNFEWANRPYQFNTPFSVVMFSDEFGENYSTFLKNRKRGIGITEPLVRKFVSKNLTTWFKNSHYDALNDIMRVLFMNSPLVDEPKSSYEISGTSEDESNANSIINSMQTIDKITERKFTLPFVTTYLVTIIMKYTNKDESGINGKEYLDKVYAPNVDVYGLLMAYLPIIERLQLTNENPSALNGLKRLFVKYIFRPAVEPYPILQIVKELKSIWVK